MTSCPLPRNSFRQQPFRPIRYRPRAKGGQSAPVWYHMLAANEPRKLIAGKHWNSRIGQSEWVEVMFASNLSAPCRRVSARRVATVLGLVFLFSTAPVARADLALDFVGITQNGFHAEITFGWSFEVNQKLIVDGLGFFDDFIEDGPGLIHDHRVRIWTEAGLVVPGLDTLITNASTPVASSAAEGEWLFNPVDSILLEPGNYVIGAYDPACSGPDCDRIRHFDTATTIPAITFIEALDHSGDGMPVSPQPERNDGYFGPTFSAYVVPEPHSLILLSGGLVVLALRRCRTGR